MRECLLIADDLTGACDAGVHFAAQGHTVSAAISPTRLQAGGNSVLAVSTDTRDLTEAEIFPVLANLRALVHDRPAKILFKKIDSVLRGMGGVEIRLLMHHFDCEAAIVTPAYPKLGRIVRQSLLHVITDPSFVPIHIPGWMEQQGLGSIRAVHAAGVASGLASGTRTVVADAACDEDLDEVVRSGLGSGLRLLWAGSAGLASALARTVAIAKRRPEAPAPRPEGVIFCVGSDHPVTLRQAGFLRRQRPTRTLHANGASARSIEQAVAKGEHVILEIPRGQVLPTRLEQILEGVSPAALLMTGGDTASLVCKSLSVESIDVFDEIVPGLPWGVLRGGPLDGTSVGTKSGGFGDETALIEVADFFTCPKH